MTLFIILYIVPAWVGPVLAYAALQEDKGHASITELFVLLIAPITWLFLEKYVGSDKSLSNFVEIPVLGAAITVLGIARLYVGFRWNPRSVLGWYLPGSAIVAWLVWTLFPALPE